MNAALWNCSVSWENLEFASAGFPLLLNSYNQFAAAIKDYWNIKASQKAASSSEGKSKDVRGGKHMDGFERLIRTVVEDAGIEPDPQPENLRSLYAWDAGASVAWNPVPEFAPVIRKVLPFCGSICAGVQPSDPKVVSAIPCLHRRFIAFDNTHG